MLSFLDVFLVLMFELNVIFDLIFYELMLISECPLEIIDPIFLLVKVVIDTCILMLVVLKFVPQCSVLV